MLEHSLFSNHQEDVVVAFSETNLYKLKQIKEALSTICKSELEPRIDQLIKGKSIQYPSSVKYFSKNGKEIAHYNQWTDQGVHCDILEPGSQGWKTGKIKIRFIVELCPDEPEVIEETPSPLDDIRQSMI